MRSTVLVAAVWFCVVSAGPLSDDEKFRLPKNFLFGAGTSAYQTEGAWQADGKGISVFDYGYHQNNSGDTSGDIASDFYGHYKEDIALAAQMGMNVFRFSMSWTRIFPTRTNETKNEKGIAHYHNLLDELHKYNITPMVTLFHFDYPQALEEDFGGWLSEKMQDEFVAYSDFIFEEYGSKVQHWLTINEAAFYCNTLGVSLLFPKTFKTPEKQNICLKNTILAHAKVHKLYEEKYKAQDKGIVGFGSGPLYYRPATDKEEDIVAAQNANLNPGIGLTIDPLVFGDYPETVRKSKIPFTDEEKELIKGRIDFVGINIYGGQHKSASGGRPGPGPFGEPGSAWVLRDMPLWIKNRYETSDRKLPVFITENGINAAGKTSPLDDWDERGVQASTFLRELAAGINENGTNVIGYTMWSLLDTYEFHPLYQNWGAVHVDFSTLNRTRTLKKSWTFFKRLTSTKVVPLVEPGSEPFSANSGPSYANVNGFCMLALAIQLILFLR